MLYSIQTPIRGTQSQYEKFIEGLEAQTCKDFELVICDDCSGREPIKPVVTSFTQRLVRIPKRLEGWAYPCARNACIKHCNRSAQYMARIDIDWVLRPDTLANMKPLLSPNKYYEGWKQQANGKLKQFGPFSIMPMDALLVCGGWDEIFFPHYSDWEDFKRRILLVRKMEVISTQTLFADDTGEADHTIIRDRKFTRPIAKLLKRVGNIMPIVTDLFASELIYRCRAKNEK